MAKLIAEKYLSLTNISYHIFLIYQRADYILIEPQMPLQVSKALHTLFTQCTNFQKTTAMYSYHAADVCRRHPLNFTKTVNNFKVITFCYHFWIPHKKYKSKHA